MDIVYQVIFGFLVGLIAKFLMPGKDPGGCIITILLGIAGSALGGWITRNYFPAFATWHWLTAIGGALLLLILYRLLFGSKQ